MHRLHGERSEILHDELRYRASGEKTDVSASLCFSVPLQDLAMYINEVKRDNETLKKIGEFQCSIENLVRIYGFRKKDLKPAPDTVPKLRTRESDVAAPNQ